MSSDNELHRVLGEISSDVKHILVRQDKQDARLERMDSRIVRVEKFQWKLTGAMAAVTAAMGAALKYFT